MKKTTILVLAALALSAPIVTTGCSAEVAEEEATVGESEDNLAPAIAIAACLADPPCAAAVALTIGYAAKTLSDIVSRDRPAAASAADNYYAKNGTCTVKCWLVLANSSGGVGTGGQCEGSVSGSGKNHTEAQKDANKQVPRGCRLKHCSPCR